MRKFIIAIICLSLYSCSNTKWTNNKNIQKHNYQTIIGDLSGLDSTDRPDTYPLYPDGINGINNLLIENINLFEVISNDNVRI